MNEGALFRKLRKDRGFSLEQISDEMNSVSFISKFEKGNSNISLHRIERLLENINVSMEEYLYLRELEKKPDLNEDIKILRGHLTSDFYYYISKVMKIEGSMNSIGDEKVIKKLKEIKKELNPKINWQRFILIYCDIGIFISHSNMNVSKNTSAESVMNEVNYRSKPIISYLYKVEDWGVFEVILFRAFLFSFKVEQINQLLPLAISRTQKEKGLNVMAFFKVEIIFSSFSYFVNFRHQKWAKNSLEMARKLLKNENDLTSSTMLLFYEGWYQLIFADEEKGKILCHQAISIFKILEQIDLEEKFKYIFSSILKNKETPDEFLMFV